MFTLGSDARSLKNILSSDDSGNYCWIKANPTFEGIKQILYEPTLRVSLDEINPEQKEDYRIIDKVVFDDESFT